jgi:uncharacterized damage-inducible protein DinB
MARYHVLGLERSSGALVLSAELVTPSRRRIPTGEGRFSPLEVLAHLADWEPIFAGRIRQAIENPGSEIVPQDESERAINGKYSEQQWEAVLAQFRHERKRTLAFVESLTPEQWNASLVHPEEGDMTVMALVLNLIGHDAYHLEQLLGLHSEDAVGTW